MFFWAFNGLFSQFWMKSQPDNDTFTSYGGYRIGTAQELEENIAQKTKL